MDTTMAVTRLQAALDQQVVLAGSDPAVESASRALLAALHPALQSLAMELAEQAAAEVGVQLPGHQIEVVLHQGEPTLRVQAVEEGAVPGESLDARITLRLSPRLKELVEEAAGERGESVNTWLVRVLSSTAGGRLRRTSRRVSGMIRT